MTKLELSKNRKERKTSDHFDGKRFFNPQGPDERSFLSFLKWQWSRKALPWPKKRDLVLKTLPRERLDSNECVITFVNHSTVLIQWEGLNVLTDPIWSERCGPMGLLGPKRVHPPGLAFEHLPPIDLVLISHNHYDHLDVRTLKKLNSLHHPRFITGLGNKKLLHKHGINRVEELDWWEEIGFTDFLKIAFVPAKHFSARSLLDRNRSLWGGFVLSASSGCIYFAGDTGYGFHFKKIYETFGPPRLALLPIGAYEPRWFMEPVHLSPEEALNAHHELKAKTSVGIHFGTFHLSDEGIDEPWKKLKNSMVLNGISDEAFWVLQPGQQRKVPLSNCI